MTEQTATNRQELSTVKLILLIFGICMVSALLGLGGATLGESLGGAVGSSIGMVLAMIGICWAASRKIHHQYLSVMFGVIIIAAAVRVGEQIGLHISEAGGLWGSRIAFFGGVGIFVVLTLRAQNKAQTAEPNETQPAETSET